MDSLIIIIVKSSIDTMIICGVYLSKRKNLHKKCIWRLARLRTQHNCYTVHQDTQKGVGFTKISTSGHQTYTRVSSNRAAVHGYISSIQAPRENSILN